MVGRAGAGTHVTLVCAGPYVEARGPLDVLEGGFDFTAGQLQVQLVHRVRLPVDRAQPVGLDHASEPLGAGLGRAHLGVVVDVDDPEAVGEALRPLEVVEQRPHDEAPQVDRIGDGGPCGFELPPPPGDAPGCRTGAPGTHLYFVSG